MALNEHEFEQRLGLLLRAGVTLSAIVVLSGGVLYLMRHGQEPPEYHVFHSEPVRFRAIAGIVESAAQCQGQGIIQLGLLLLIATPITRVAFSAVGFARQRDWLYVGVACIVLALLAYGILAMS